MARRVMPEFKGMKWFQSLSILSLIIFSACTKEASKDSKPNLVIDSESFPIENTTLKNCRFKIPNPTYTFGSTIEPNPILCDEGVPKRAEILTPAAPPNGIQLSSATLSLVGIANERVVQAPYDIYLENESGYAIIKIQISIR